MSGASFKAEVGFEPTNHGFAIRSLSPLGHSAVELVGTGYNPLYSVATYLAYLSKTIHLMGINTVNLLPFARRIQGEYI